MLEGSETLYSLAEVSATFVGLSLVVGVLTGGDVSFETKLKKVYLRSFAFLGLSVVAGCFLPVVFYHYQVGVSNTWRLSSLVFLCLWVGGWLSNRSQIESTRELIRSRRFSFFVSLVLVLVGWGLLVWNVIAPGEHSLAMYITAMMFALILGTRFFYTSTFSVD